MVMVCPSSHEEVSQTMLVAVLGRLARNEFASEVGNASAFDAFCARIEMLISIPSCDNPPTFEAVKSKYAEIRI